MATLAVSTRPFDAERMAARWGLVLVLAATLAVRCAAIVAFHQLLESDGLSYWTIADTVAHGGVPTDNYGNHAFFSPGYPLLLVPAFRVLGSGVGVALAMNLLLACASAGLVWRLARVLAGSAVAATLAGVGYAGWLPGVWSATVLARENLSVPLLLGFVVAVLGVQRTPVWASVAAGLCWGGGLLAGTSVLFTIVGFGAAIYILLNRNPFVSNPSTAWKAGAQDRLQPSPEVAIRHPSLAQRFSTSFETNGAVRCCAAFVLAALLVVTPWLATTATIFGRPVLTTSGGFNLYVGNNPLATGRFVSMKDLPLGAGWRAHRATDGELAAGAFAGDLAERYASAHPARTAAMGLKKLALFWAPNVPDADDFRTARAVAAFRLVEVAEYLLIVALALLAFWRRHVPSPARLVLAATIAGFWAIHALTYIIPRYRDPAMPLLIACAALPVAGWLRSRHHAR